MQTFNTITHKWTAVNAEQAAAFRRFTAFSMAFMENVLAGLC